MLAAQIELDAKLQMLQWSFALTGLGFVLAFGAICGSFINVLVYRLPRGLNVVHPPSACPSCGTRLSWRENLPVLGWAMLGGKCRFCRSKISAEYPLVEAVVSLLFGALFVLWFMKPSPLSLLGVNPGVWRADFALEGLGRTWPMLMAVYALVGSLVAATLIDARTFTIPLALPWFATIVGFAVHPLHALWIGTTQGGLRVAPFTWTIPVPGEGMLGMAIGGVLGIGVGVALLQAGLLRRSFEDYEQWEAGAIEAEKLAAAAAAQARAESAEAAPAVPARSRALLGAVCLVGPALALMLLGFALGLPTQNHGPYMIVGASAGLLLGMVLRRLVADSGDGADDPIWIRYPHARREMLREVLFLAPCLGLGWLGWWLCRAEGPWSQAALDAPLWVRALGGACAGYLMGGGLVWFFRIFGSLMLGKEAMGLGDVHLLAAAGAVLGWMDPLLAFFTAPFLGIGWAALSVMFRQVFHRQGTALPYGPHLAAAVLLVLFLKPVYELGLSAMFGRTLNIP
jgi:prepilin signal peptidase PulO-like enzyme (type II secretory pathway)